MSAIDALRNRGKPTEAASPPDLSEPEVETNRALPAERDKFTDLVASLDEEDQSEAVVEAMRRQVGPRATRLMRSAVALAREHTSVENSNSLLDDTIMSMRQAGLSHRKIAAELDGMSEDEVAARLSGMYVRMEQVTTAEYRMLQVGRLEQVINMCWDLASQGSDSHIELLSRPSSGSTRCSSWSVKAPKCRWRSSPTLRLSCSCRSSPACWVC